MPLIRCPHCREDTFTFAGWAELDHCAHCGQPLGRDAAERGTADDRDAPELGVGADTGGAEGLQTEAGGAARSRAGRL
jgi:hypothetical protein